MNQNTKKLKAIVLSLGLGVAMFTTISVQAQMINLLDEYYEELDQNNNQQGVLNMRGNLSVESNNFTIADFVEPTSTPLGSGIVILIGAGLGYVALKKKEDKQ